MADGSTVVIPYSPRKAFLPFHNRAERFAALVCHRRAGKTVATINDIVKRAIECRRPAPRYAYLAPLHRQAKDIAWDYLKRYTAPIPGREVNESELRVDLPGDRRIRLYGADNPDSLRGLYLDGVVVDEPAQMKPAMWQEVLRPALADREGFAVFIGTPKGRNWFYDIYRRGEKDSDWFTMTLKASVSGILSEAERQALVADMTPALIAQEMECSFEESGTVQFIPTEVVDAARARSYPNSGGARVMGVDVARFGDDRSVILTRKDTIETIRVFKGMDTQQLAAMVAEEAGMVRPDAIFVDGGGVGGGVVDRLKMLGFRVIEVQAGSKANDTERYLNKRAEMWGKMREWLKERGAIPDSQYANELVDDLVSPQYSFDNAGRIVLEKKDDMKDRGIPSPDLGDALALTFAQPVAPPELKAAREAKRRPQYHNPLDGYLT